MRAPIDPFIRGAAAPVAYPDTDTGDGGRRFFTDVRFPATRDDIYASAVEHGAPATVLEAIRHLPAEEVFGHPRDVPDLHALAQRYHASRAEEPGDARRT